MIRVSIPLATEVIRAHEGLVTSTCCDGQEVVIKMDVRKACWPKILKLKPDTKIHWADVRTVKIRELSSWLYPMSYQLTYGDGWYRGPDGKRCYFPLQPHLRGIDLARQCTTVTIRAAILLAVMGGVGLRSVCWLMKMLFQVDISKSAVDRWVNEAASQLPDAEGMAHVLHRDKPITEAHFDEIFAKGQRPKVCTLVLRDEHGRIIAVEEVTERTEATVTAFLQKVKGWGLAFRAFYVDGCDAYRKAIGVVYPEAAIQYDYFHVIQNLWRKLRHAFVQHRKTVKERSQQSETPAYRRRLENLARRLWEQRGLVFKNPENLTQEEKQQLCELIEADSVVESLRTFMVRVWGIFNDSASERGAKQRLLHLKRYSVLKQGKQPVFGKCITFLEERFADMTAFLRYAHVRRNSLAETGIRCLRRLERGHDGFRGADGLDTYLRLYQAIKYLGWDVHRPPGNGLGLPHTAAVAGQSARHLASAPAAT